MIRKSKIRAETRLKAFSAVFLLLLYIAGNVQVESLHEVFHSLEKSLHSSELEKDPCHRAIYHNSSKEGCDHKFHVTAVKKCPLCHVVPINESGIVANHSFQLFYWQNEFDDGLLSGLAVEPVIALPARAPPVC